MEEAYELADAIERDDDDGILEETGDILLQAAFHSLLKEEQGVFNATDATTANVKKLIFRHSHIFGGDKAASESEALGVWDKNKLKEKHMTTFGESVSAVPKNFPACMRAQERYGFSFPRVGFGKAVGGSKGIGGSNAEGR